MRMYDLIMKKRNGEALTEQEIQYMIREYVAGEIPDYQMSAFLMAVYFKGMTEEETLAMTQAVAHSGEMVDLSGIEGVKVDKHSTGGVGDKTTMIIAPIVAACGVKVAKMSGRGLGHTGGTVDSIPLIAVSIMSKKLAAGNDCILLDVKTGSGAFMKSIDDSIALAKEMVAIGENAGRKTVALITDMDIPLGHNIGNSLEVIEAVETLKGNGPEDLTEVCVHLASNMLFLAGKGTLEECRSLVREVIANGEALKRLAAMVEAQGGDSSVIFDTDKFEKAAYQHEVLAKKSGYITFMDTESCGIASAMLGAGRETKDSQIDFAAGIILKKKVGDYVEAGEPMAVFYADKEELFAAAELRYQAAVTIEDEKANETPLVYARVTKDQVERLA